MEAVGDVITPANALVAVIVLVALVVGVRRAVRGLTRGQSCCSDGVPVPAPQQAEVADTDCSHYPYAEEFLIGGMSCEGCARRVEGAIDALDDVWATVDLREHTARVLGKTPIDRPAVEAAVKGAGYYVMKP